MPGFGDRKPHFGTPGGPPNSHHPSPKIQPDPKGLSLLQVPLVPPTSQHLGDRSHPLRSSLSLNPCLGPIPWAIFTLYIRTQPTNAQVWAPMVGLHGGQLAGTGMRRMLGARLKASVPCPVPRSRSSLTPGGQQVGPGAAADPRSPALGFIYFVPLH